MTLKKRPRCSAGNHVGCSASKVNLELLATQLGSTPSKVGAILKKLREHNKYEGCWATFIYEVEKNKEILKFIEDVLKQT